MAVLLSYIRGCTDNHGNEHQHSQSASQPVYRAKQRSWCVLMQTHSTLRGRRGCRQHLLVQHCVKARRLGVQHLTHERKLWAVDVHVQEHLVAAVHTMARDEVSNGHYTNTQQQANKTPYVSSTRASPGASMASLLSAAFAKSSCWSALRVRRRRLEEVALCRTATMAALNSLSSTSATLDGLNPTSGLVRLSTTCSSSSNSHDSSMRQRPTTCAPRPAWCASYLDKPAVPPTCT